MKNNVKATLFNTVEVKVPNGNKFDLTHDVKLSAKMGELVPVMALEVLPGDSFNISPEMLIRFAPIIRPLMHRIDAHIHYWFVPNRLSWENFDEFISAQTTGGHPVVEMNNALTPEQERFLNYFGIPPFSEGAGTVVNINALPLAAYQRIYNEFYRDQNLSTEANADLSDGLNPIGDLATMRYRAWEHDYFTSCLPSPQMGSAVELPLGDVVLKSGWTGQPAFEDIAGTQSTGTLQQPAMLPNQIETSTSAVKHAYNPDGTLETEPTTIQDLRRAFKLSEWLEILIRAGRRYKEVLKAYFGVETQDSRLDRPEYITGMKTPVIISEVLNTTGEAGGLPQGNQAGHAIAIGGGQSGSYFIPEHGWIIGIMSVIPKTAYQQGIHRSFLKEDYLDYYWPQFAHIGEQEVLNNEIMAYEPSGTGVFGYIPRYSELKYMPNRVAGDFRTTYADFHLGRIFANLPTLSQQFIEVDPDEQDRIFAVQNGDDYLYCQVVNKIIAYRKMPVFGNPQL